MTHTHTHTHTLAGKPGDNQRDRKDRALNSK